MEPLCLPVVLRGHARRPATPRQDSGRDVRGGCTHGLRADRRSRPQWAGRAHINPALGNRLVTAITPDDCEAFILKVQPKRFARPLSIKTKKSIARTLHALFSFAVKKRKRPDNPAAGLPAVVNDPDASPDDGAIDPKDHTKFFAADEAQHLLATCREKFPEWHPFVLTGLQTGMRLVELLALRYDQINWRGGYITVNRAWVKSRLTSPKNGRSRTVSMSRDLRTVLYLRWRRHRTSELVFPSSAGTPLESSRLQRFWSRSSSKPRNSAIARVPRCATRTTR